jgi:hypothetical protein
MERDFVIVTMISFFMVVAIIGYVDLMIHIRIDKLEDKLRVLRGRADD